MSADLLKKKNTALWNSHWTDDFGGQSIELGGYTQPELRPWAYHVFVKWPDHMTIQFVKQKLGTVTPPVR